MKDSLAREKPTLFQDDTTFGTQEEGFKLNIPIYIFVRNWGKGSSIDLGQVRIEITRSKQRGFPPK